MRWLRIHHKEPDVKALRVYFREYVQPPRNDSDVLDLVERIDTTLGEKDRFRAEFCESIEVRDGYVWTSAMRAYPMGMVQAIDFAPALVVVEPSKPPTAKPSGVRKGKAGRKRR